MSSFWNLVLEPGKRYEKQVDNGIHVTRAALDTTNCPADAGLVQVVLEHELKEIVVGTLSMKHGIFQTPLDLMFQTAGETIAFTSTGANVPVTLTGMSGMYDDSDDDDETGSDEEGLEEDSALLDSDEEPTLVEMGGKKRQASQLQSSKAAKKAKKEMTLNGHSFMSEDDSDDQCYNPMADLNDSQMAALPDEEDVEEDDSDDDDDEDEDDEEEDSDDEEDDEEDESSEEEEAAVQEPPKKQQKKEAAKSPKVSPPKAAAPQTPKQGKLEKLKAAAATSVKDSSSPKKEGKLSKSEKVNTPLKTDNKDKENKTPKLDKKKAKELKKLNGESPAPQKTPKKMVGGGVMIEDVKLGTGQEVKAGNMVSVYYEGRLKSNNKVFDKLQSGAPFKFRLGRGEVIQGWDVGVKGMKVGGQRRLMVPPPMGYGKRGASPQIPPNAFLNFDVTVVGVN